MTFSLVVPRANELHTKKMPILYVLSGLTCNDRNFTDKVKTAQAEAIKLGIVLAIPDTSPRRSSRGTRHQSTHPIRQHSFLPSLAGPPARTIA